MAGIPPASHLTPGQWPGATLDQTLPGLISRTGSLGPGAGAECGKAVAIAGVEGYDGGMLGSSLLGYALSLITPVALWLAQGTAAAPPRKRWVAVVIGLLLVAGVVVASVLNPRRSHRD